MNVLIFAAGLGTRLRPLTDTRPKALVEVCGKPLLWHVIQKVISAGATEIVVNVHHFGEQIIDYLAHHDFGVPIRVSDEREKLLDTGGGLRQALSLFSNDAPVLIHNVDILSSGIDLADFYRRYADADAALAVSWRETQRYLLFSDEGRLEGWTNIATGEVRSPYSGFSLKGKHQYAFSGIHLVSPRLKDLLQNYPEAFPIMDFYLNECHRLRIMGHVCRNLQLLDVGKRGSVEAAEEFLHRTSL